MSEVSKETSFLYGFELIPIYLPIVYAMYNQSKAVLTLILLCFVSEVALMVTTLILVIPKQTFTPDCLVAGSPRIYIAYWWVSFCERIPRHFDNTFRLSSLFFETFLFVLTLIKFFRSIKLEYSRHSIMFLFVRDGTWAYAIIFSKIFYTNRGPC